MRIYFLKLFTLTQHVFLFVKVDVDHGVWSMVLVIVIL